jgi:hypothetical protein
MGEGMRASFSKAEERRDYICGLIRRGMYVIDDTEDYPQIPKYTVVYRKIDNDQGFGNREATR